MSIRVMARIWDHGPDDREALLVLLALADFADDAGRCFPSMASISRKARLTERGAQKIVRRLEATGWLTIKTGGGRGGANVYQIENPEHETPNEKQGLTFAPEPECTKPRTRVHKTPNTGSPEPSGTTKEPSKSNAHAILAEIVGADTADAFLAHRKAKRAPMTDQAATLIARKLGGCRDPVACVEESIANGWTGVFPRDDKNGRDHNPGIDARTAAMVAAGRRRDARNGGR